MATAALASSLGRSAARRHMHAMTDDPVPPPPTAPEADPAVPPKPAAPPPVAEIGGRKGPEPTRYGDWELNGRCIDF